MIGQHTSLSFVHVKPELSSPESARRNGGSSINVGADIPFDYDDLANQSAFSYNLTYAVHNSPDSVPMFPVESPLMKPLAKIDTSPADLSDNASIYSPRSTFSPAPINAQLPSGSNANSSDPPRTPAFVDLRNAAPSVCDNSFDLPRTPAFADLRNAAPSVCDHYECPRYYFEALVEDAQIRYDKASEFFANMRTYSSKCDVYITILQDLFVELAKPPPTLKPELYKRLARLRRSIRHLELKMASRRPRTAVAAVPARCATPAPVVDLCERSTPTVEAANAAANLDVTSSVQEPVSSNNLQEYCLRQVKMKEILEQKIYDLTVKERELRQERREAEAELHYLFGGGVDSSSVFGATNRPKYNCIFCGKHSQSHTCWNLATLEERQAFFRMYKICFSCGKQHYGDCHIAEIVVCAWPQCGAKGDHNSIFCPKVTYPITKSQVMAFRASQNMPTTFVCPSEAKKEVPVSNELPVSHPSRAQSPLSKSLSMSQSRVADPSKRTKKRVTVTVLKEPPTKKQCC